MLRLKIYIFVIFVLASFQACAVDKKSLSLKDISAIESNIVLPTGAYPLSDYDRFYSITEVNGLKKLVGIYLHREQKIPEFIGSNLIQYPL